MESKLLLVIILHFSLTVSAQHPPSAPKPALVNPHVPDPRYAPPPPKPEDVREVIEQVNQVIDEFKKINDSTAGRVYSNDTLNRQIRTAFPVLFLLTRVEYPDKPSDNHTRKTYTRDFLVASSAEFDVEKKNKFSDDRCIYNYKEKTITNLRTDKEGKKKATETPFHLLNWAPDGSMIAVNNEGNSGSRIQKTGEQKEISGYICTKYLKEDLSGRMEIWMTEDSSLSVRHITDAMMKALFTVSASVPNTFSNYQSVLKGTPIQLLYIPMSKSSPRCMITYKKIESGSTDEKIFSREGYNVQQLQTIQEVYNSRF